MRKPISLVLLIVLALFGAACGGGDDDPTIGSPSANETTGDPTDEPTEDCEDQGDAASVTMNDNEFDPTCFSIGTAASLHIQNDGAAEHTFTIDGTPVDFEVPPGESLDEEGPPPLEPGEYTFFCRYHGTAAGGGMSGTLTIT